MNISAVFLTLVALSVPIIAQGGGETGHGGGAVVCRDSSGAIVSAELLDFWEGEVQDGLRILRSNLPVNRQIEDAILLMPTVGPRIRKELKHLREIARDVPNGTVIVPPSDAENDLMKEGCRLEGVARYLDSRRDAPPVLFMDPRIYSFLSKSDQAGLWIHEAVYKYYRDRGAKNSVGARQVTARLFTESVRRDALPVGKEVLRCDGSGPTLFFEPGREKIRIWYEGDSFFLRPWLRSMEVRDADFANFIFLSMYPTTREAWDRLPSYLVKGFGTPWKRIVKMDFQFKKTFEFDPSQPVLEFYLETRDGEGRTGSYHRARSHAQPGYGCLLYTLKPGTFFRGLRQRP